MKPSRRRNAAQLGSEREVPKHSQHPPLARAEVLAIVPRAVCRGRAPRKAFQVPLGVSRARPINSCAVGA